MHSPLESFTPLRLDVAPQRLHCDVCIVTVGWSIDVFEEIQAEGLAAPSWGTWTTTQKGGAVSSPVAVSSTVRQA
jgi:hypothetical protein